jgi:hypothetical protein
LPPRIERSPLHFATFRSGSVPIGIALECYFRRNHGLIGLGDLFEDDDDHRLWRDAPAEHFPRGQAPLNTDGKLNFLRRDPRRYFFTFYAGYSASQAYPLCPAAEPRAPSARRSASRPAAGLGLWLMMNYDFIFSERENLVSQILSYLVAEGGGGFYRTNAPQPQPNGVRAKLRHFKHIENQLLDYHRVKAALKPRRVVTYEMFFGEGPEAALRHVGLRRPFNRNGLELPRKQNHTPKIEFIANKDQVRNWYRNSFMEGLCPWRRGLPQDR